MHKIAAREFYPAEMPTKEFYIPGIAMLGRPRQLAGLRSAFDALRKNSPTADKLIGLVGDFYNKSIDRGPLAVVHGPVHNDMCRCPTCPSKYTNMYHCLPDGKEPLIVYTPMPCMLDGSEPYMIVPPEIALGHELVHAYHGLKGSYLMGMNVNLEEARTVGLGPFRLCEFTENAIRKDYGIPLRPRY